MVNRTIHVGVMQERSPGRTSGDGDRGGTPRTRREDFGRGGGSQYRKE